MLWTMVLKVTLIRMAAKKNMNLKKMNRFLKEGHQTLIMLRRHLSQATGVKWQARAKLHHSKNDHIKELVY